MVLTKKKSYSSILLSIYCEQTKQKKKRETFKTFRRSQTTL